jgi:F-type H+/Na+-transporting ATPase subunit alpha
MSTLIEQIEQEIRNLDASTQRANVGRITSIADGVARVDGLSEVMFNEMIAFPGGLIGQALNLEEDEVGCVVFGDVSQLRQGDEVKSTGKLFSVPVGKALLGRTVDALGKPD